MAQIPANPSVDVESLKPFKKFIMTIGNLPTSYLESLSYAELVMWFCNFLQEQVIPAVNNNASAVEELQGLYIELKSYVDNYFTDLDVQEEINNKLDEMVEDGTLTNLIGNYMTPIINMQNNAITNINNKVDSVASGSPLVASSTSEMTETDRVYVNTTNGHWYWYDGTTWQDGGVYQSAEDSTTVNDLNTKMNYIIEKCNLKLYGAEYGSLTANGSEVENTIRCRTKIINTIAYKSFITKYDTDIKIRIVVKDSTGWRNSVWNTDLTVTDTIFGKMIKFINTNITAMRYVFENKNDNTQDITDAQLKSVEVIPYDESIFNYILNNISDTMKYTNNTALVYDVEYGGFTSDGSEVENTIRCRTKAIKIKSIKSLKFNGNLIFNNIIGYKNNIWSIININPINNIITINDEDLEYIRISFKNENNTDISENDKNSTYIKIINNEYSGKKYVALGDSITYGYIPRNETGYPGQLNSYAKLVADKLGMNFVNAGINGNTVASTSDINNPMCVRYTDLPNDADIITIMGGTNDIRKNVPLGNMNDRITSTFYGALHLLLGGLYKKYFIDQGIEIGKNKKIIVITPIKLLLSSSNVQGGTGTLYNFDPYINAIKEVAKYYSFPVLDMYNLSNINPHLNETIAGTDLEGYFNPYIPDGTHPNQSGAEIMANVLLDYLKSNN